MSKKGEKNTPGKNNSNNARGKKSKEGKDGKNKEGPKSFWSVVLVGSCLVVLLGLMMAVLSFMARGSAKNYLEFIDGFDNGEFLMVLAVIGFVSALVGVYGVAVAYLSSNPVKYQRIRYLVLAYIGWGIGLALLLLVSFWLTFTAVGSLDLVFKPGFTASLVKYVKEEQIRNSIDALQRDLECCGNYNHTEWFTVSWSEIVSKTDSAIPESCCDKATVAAQRIQCITSAPFGETIKLTPYQNGCVKAAVKYYGSTLNLRGAMMIGIAIIQIAIVALVIIEVRKAPTEAAAAAADGEMDKLLTKAEAEKRQRVKASASGVTRSTTVGGLSKQGSKASEMDVDESAAAATSPVAGYFPGTSGYPAPSPNPYAAGYGAVPGYGGPGYNMYYGAQ